MVLSMYVNSVWRGPQLNFAAWGMLEVVATSLLVQVSLLLNSKGSILDCAALPTMSCLQYLMSVTYCLEVTCRTNSIGSGPGRPGCMW